MPMTSVPNVGTWQDSLQRQELAHVDDENRRKKMLHARQLICKSNYAVNSAHIERLLKDKSLVPTANMFSEKLSEFGFNLFVMLVVHLLHEFELGVWKAIFTHLLCILDSLKDNKLHILDHRYCQVPTFGRATIRCFTNNLSEMKQMAAHNFEDLLQYALPVFEGLLPEPHNSAVLELLYLLCDPAVQDFTAKLKHHLLPQIQAIHGCQLDRGSSSQQQHVESVNSPPLIDQVLFKGSHIYQHNVMHINYTSFVDHDMLLRYHWGSGVGHTYSHTPDMAEHLDQLSYIRVSPGETQSLDNIDGSGDTLKHQDSDNPDVEFSLTNQDMLEWETIGNEIGPGDDGDDKAEDELDVGEMYEMYGSDWENEEDLD
ncbi:hypothetical protein PAXINDRAFT_16115 [Paxillus involutus ATCC 200175]|uniref:Uncharacterized protein n=1 Tax=Paxillus involutus ATCC 200175 TaxID=664439 RepID=A0A0C9TJQ1_PAXIN|nr:hypothetical protein PAXINDRAFT_16115 [Paxillus involutus ATCC 200175]